MITKEMFPRVCHHLTPLSSLSPLSLAAKPASVAYNYDVASPRTTEFLVRNRPGEKNLAQFVKVVKLVFFQPGTDDALETLGSILLTNHRIFFKAASHEKDWGKKELLIVPLYSIASIKGEIKEQLITVSCKNLTSFCFSFKTTGLYTDFMNLVQKSLLTIDVRSTFPQLP